MCTPRMAGIDPAFSIGPFFSRFRIQSTRLAILPRHYYTNSSILTLHFVSGFGDGQPGQENQTKTCMDNKTADYMQCAKHLYATTKILGIPGSPLPSSRFLLI